MQLLVYIYLLENGYLIKTKKYHSFCKNEL